jgi:Protein of unknown function (DUF1461)
MDKTKKIALNLFLFYLTIYIPIAGMSYLPQWYTVICKLHPRCDFIGQKKAVTLIDELTGFFIHQNDLRSGWTQKEKKHLAEVRDLLDVLAAMAVVAAIGLAFTFNKKYIAKTALINMAIIIVLSTLLLFFKFFWTQIFHPLLFNNNLWKNNPFDRSFYIMPGIFFKYSMIAFFLGSLSINAITWIFTRKFKVNRDRPPKIR